MKTNILDNYLVSLAGRIGDLEKNSYANNIEHAHGLLMIWIKGIETLLNDS